MVDIHCHILPGMDDGASDFKTAEQMLQTAAEDGIDTLICTPHYSPKAYRDCPRVLEKLAGSAKAAGIRLLPGMEYSFARLDAGIENLRPLGESSFVLIDLGVPNLPPSIEELFFLLGRNNMQIIIAHPERYLTEVESALELLRLGAFFQLHADSILGGNGPRCRRMAARLIRSGCCHYVASDAHGRHRTFRLSRCRAHLEQRCGKAYAGTIMDTNPERLLKNLPPVSLRPEENGNWLLRLLKGRRPQRKASV